MNRKGRQWARNVTQKLFPEDYIRLERIRIHDLGFGYDPFGLEMESAMMAFSVLKFIYQYWFRTQSHGVENVPLEGPALIAPNHSGVLPIDGAMIAVDLALKMKTPRVMRAVVDNFAGYIPFVSTFFTRAGQIFGARRNFEELLKQGELVAVFPEGHKGTCKPFRDRYRVRPFNVGFIEMSLLHRAPIIPSAVVGAEEQYPYRVNLKPLARMLGFPYFPITPLLPFLGPLGLLPLPTQYTIYYDEAFHFYRDYPPETVRDLDTIRMLADTVRNRVQELTSKGLHKRKGVFGFSARDLPSLSRLKHLLEKGVANRGKTAHAPIQEERSLKDSGVRGHGEIPGAEDRVLPLMGDRAFQPYAAEEEIVYSHDPAGNLTFVNKAAERITGCTREELLRMNITQIVAPEHADKVSRIVRSQKGGRKSGSCELDILARDGRRVPVEVNLCFIHEQDRPVAVHGIAHEITGQKRIETEWARYRRRLEEMLEERTAGLGAAMEQQHRRIMKRIESEIKKRKFMEAKEKQTEERTARLEHEYESLKEMEKKSVTFFSTMTHELHVFLDSLRLFSEALSHHKELDPKIRSEFLQFLDTEGERMTSLVHNIPDTRAVANPK